MYVNVNIMCLYLNVDDAHLMEHVVRADVQQHVADVRILLPHQKDNKKSEHYYCLLCTKCPNCAHSPYTDITIAPTRCSPILSLTSESHLEAVEVPGDGGDGQASDEHQLVMLVPLDGRGVEADGQVGDEARGGVAQGRVDDACDEIRRDAQRLVLRGRESQEV